MSDFLLSMSQEGHGLRLPTALVVERLRLDLLAQGVVIHSFSRVSAMRSSKHSSGTLVDVSSSEPLPTRSLASLATRSTAVPA